MHLYVLQKTLYLFSVSLADTVLPNAPIANTKVSAKVITLWICFLLKFISMCTQCSVLCRNLSYLCATFITYIRCMHRSFLLRIIQPRHFFTWYRCIRNPGIVSISSSIKRTTTCTSKSVWLYFCR